MQSACSIILAAGDGKRMKSKRPKVLSEVLFRPMIRWVTESCLEAGISRGCVVLGSGAEEVRAVLPEQFTDVLQQERLGTGHAAMMARDFLRSGDFSHVAVLNGDAPFISAGDLRASLHLHQKKGNHVTVISSRLTDPTGYGRIVRHGDTVAAIVEQADVTEEQSGIDEINSGAYWFETGFLLEYFDHMGCSNAQGEYYLTDSVAYAIQTGRSTGAYVASKRAVLGANDREGLALLNGLARKTTLEMHRENGVNIPFEDGVVIGPGIKIGPDTTILPGTVLKGSTVIGEGCEIGPNSYLDNATLGNHCRVLSTYIDSSTLEDGVKIGPMSNVRPGCLIKQGCKIGDFVELKNSVVGEETAVAHLTYVGDTDAGARCNFGCGVVTVNYDGGKKHRTVIGDDVFIGCNTNLVAPVKLGDRSYSAAGTTVTEDVPDDSLVIGRARQYVKRDWAKGQGKYRRK